MGRIYHFCASTHEGLYVDDFLTGIYDLTTKGGQDLLRYDIAHRINEGEEPSLVRGPDEFIIHSLTVVDHD